MSTRSAVTGILNSPYLLWCLLAVPGIYWITSYRLEKIFYGELIHLTGDFAVQILIITLAVTPLFLLFPGKAWVRWLRARRRYLRVVAFGYALLHTAVYIERRPNLTFILEDATQAGIWTGWLGLSIMLVLALTSNDTSIRWLGKNWQRLHRAVYIATALTFAHWILTAFDPKTAYVYLGVVVCIKVLHLMWVTTRKSYRRE